MRYVRHLRLLLLAALLCGLFLLFIQVVEEGKAAVAQGNTPSALMSALLAGN